MKKVTLALTVILGLALLASCAAKREQCPGFGKLNTPTEKHA